MTRFSRSERRNEIISSIIFGTVSAVERIAPVHGTHPSDRMRHDHALRLLARQQVPFVVDHDDRAAANHHVALLREIQRHDRNVFQVDVEPHVRFGPVRQRKHANAFALVDARIENVPQFRPLIFGVPLPERIAEGIDALLGARFFLVAPRAAKRRRKIALGQRIQQRFRLQQAAAFLRAQHERIRARVQRFLILVHDQFRADLPRVAVAKLDHLRKFVAGVDVQQRKRNFPRKESLLRQPQHHRGIFADGIQHHRPRKLRHRLAQDVDALRLQRPEVIDLLRRQERSPLAAAIRGGSIHGSLGCLSHRRRFLPIESHCSLCALKQKTHQPGFPVVGSNHCQSEFFAGVTTLSTLPWNKRNMPPDNNSTRRPLPSG